MNEQVAKLLKQYGFEESWSKSLIESHLKGTRVNKLLNISADKYVRLCKKLLPNKPKNKKVLIYILELEGLKLCAYCENIKPVAEFSVHSSNCKVCHNQQQKDYYYRNPEVQVQRVRKRERNLDRSLTSEEIRIIFEKCNNQCTKCKYNNEQHNVDWGTNLHIDHILPFSKGGLTTVENSQLLCIKCNTSKGSRID